jgi:hypothetical protein
VCWQSVSCQYQSQCRWGWVNCVLGRIHPGQDCIFEVHKSGKLRMEIPDRTTGYILHAVTLVVIDLNCKSFCYKFSQEHS